MLNYVTYSVRVRNLFNRKYKNTTVKGVLFSTESSSLFYMLLLRFSSVKVSAVIHTEGIKVGKYTVLFGWLIFKFASFFVRSGV